MNVERIKNSIWYMNAKFLSNPKAKSKADVLIECKPTEIRFYANTPNTIIHFNTKYKEGFFRECRMHAQPRQYVNDLLDDYCQYIFVNEHSDECRKLLAEKLLDENNFKLFFNMGAGTASYSPINQFRRTKDSRIIGLPLPYPKWFSEQLLDLVQFAWGALDEYRYNSFLKYGEYHVYSANKTMVTRKMAELIGAEEIIPDTYYAWLEFAGKKRFGIVVAPAVGCSPYDLSKETKYHISGSFQRQLITLNILDAICYQRDHRPGNYFVHREGDVLKDIAAFDNDCPTTMAPSMNINFESYVGCSSIVKMTGEFNRPYIDIEVYKRVMNLEREKIQKVVMGQTSKIQFWALWIRIRKLKKALSISIKTEHTKVLQRTEWNDMTVREELEGTFGMTYLKFLQFKCLMEGRE